MTQKMTQHTPSPTPTIRIVTSYPNDARSLRRVINALLSSGAVQSVDRIGYTKHYELLATTDGESGANETQSGQTNKHATRPRINPTNTLLVILTISEDSIDKALRLYTKLHPDTPRFFTLGTEYIV